MMMAQLMQSQKDGAQMKSVPPDGGTAGAVPAKPSGASATPSRQPTAKGMQPGGAATTAQLAQDQTPQKCPRCDSLNTKFCYYNNYSLSQPRHFCKNCRRYWTRGGALRNVPVGGGCRKNKRVKQRLDPAVVAVAQMGGAAPPPPGLLDLSGHRSVDGMNMIHGGGGHHHHHHHHGLMHGLLSSLNVLNMQQQQQQQAQHHTLIPPPSSLSASSLISELAQMKENNGALLLPPPGFPTPSPYLANCSSNNNHNNMLMAPASTQTSLFTQPSSLDHMPFSGSSSSSSLMQQPLYNGTSPELSPFSLYDTHSAAANCAGTLVDHLSSFNGGAARMMSDSRDQGEVKEAEMGAKGKMMGGGGAANLAAAPSPPPGLAAGMAAMSADQMNNNFFLQLPSASTGSLWNWPEMHSSSTTTTAAGALLH